MSFSPQSLLPIIAGLGPVRRVVVALSGGLDSMVLLHAVQALKREGVLEPPLAAIHVDHGLDPDSGAWANRCAEVCAALDIPLTHHRVAVDMEDAKGLEAAARRARYAVLESAIHTGDCLLMAHHADDQAETLLLQLLRGSGPHGLAGMPRKRPFGGGVLVRPLLDFDRDQLAAWAVTQELRWVEDPSNLRRSLDRNFLRLEILPRLRQRWPGLSTTLSRSARLCGETSELLEALADVDLQAAAGQHARELRWAAVSTLSTVRRRNLLRHWIARCGMPLPNAKRLERMAVDFWAADPDRNPSLGWENVELHRYRDTLQLMPKQVDFDSARRLRWKPGTAVTVAGAGTLRARQVMGSGLAVARLDGAEVEIRFRQGGERCRPVGRQGSHPVKKLLQEEAVPPWQRDRIPLIYRGGELVAIADRVVCEDYAAAPDERGWLLIWEPEC